MNFKEKNDFLVKYTSGEHFYKDYELFKIHCPNSRLHSDLKRVNSFNRKKLDGLMLWELLGKISSEEILNNRNAEVKEEIIETVNTTEKVKEILIAEYPEVEFAEEVIAQLVGKTKGDILNFAEFGKLFISQSEKDFEDKASDLELKGEELTDKEMELEEKEVLLEEKAHELEGKEKELSDKEAKLEKTSSKKKEVNKTNSPK